jgi:hypothetical protein
MSDSVLGESGEAAQGESGAGQGGGTTVIGEGTPANVEQPTSIYGDTKVVWPDNTEDYLKNEPSIKPFVDKEGKLNTANLLKSYHETKKMIGKDKVILPNKNSTDEEVQDFWNKIGASSKVEDYNIPENKESKLDTDFKKSLSEFAHKNKVPLAIAEKMALFMEGKASEGIEKEVEERKTKITEGLDAVKKEFGAAYDSKINIAKRLLNDVLGKGELRDSFNDPEVGSNPVILRTLVAIGEKLFKEDGFSGKDNAAAYSPAEASEQINNILMDKAHAYNNPMHPNHEKATKDMLKLFEAKRGR